MINRNVLPLLVRALLLLSVSAASLVAAQAQQVADFRIVWVNIGEAAAGTTVDGEGARAGRQLFDAQEVVTLSLQDVEVAQISVEPEITSLHVGERICISDLRIVASRADGAVIPSAPMSVSIRQSHTEILSLRRKADEICFSPTTAGEYPVRLTSLIPASDGTMRGAQFFLRVG